MKKNVRFLLAAIAILVVLLLLFTNYPSKKDSFINPYDGIDWRTVQYFDANLHTHTTYSDGRYDPHQAIDKYHKLDYHILALTDHDRDHHSARPTTLYPWTSLNDIYFEIKDKNHRRYDTTFAARANEEWQNRNPEQLGMIAVEGSELSAGHHMGSYLSNYAGANRDEHVSFNEIGERGGLAVFFHPGRYDRDAEWYINFYQMYPHVIGQEIYNSVDQFPMDREKWDHILHYLMPDRPVWGFANDDTHVTLQFGLNRNIFLLPELTIDNVREAMVTGQMYMFIPVERGDRSDVQVRGVASERGRIQLSLDGDVTEIQWITHDPATTESNMFHTGPTLHIDDVPLSATFVRAVILSNRGRTYTQPFGIVRGR